MSKTIEPYNLHTGDTFTYDGRKYTAAAEPTGEFATYLKVRDVGGNGSAHPIYFPSGTMVEVETAD